MRQIHPRSTHHRAVAESVVTLHPEAFSILWAEGAPNLIQRGGRRQEKAC